MSFTYKKRKGREYLYFEAGRQGTFYIHPKDTPSAVNVDNVEKALQYMQTRLKKDRKTIEKLMSYLPKERRQEYTRVM